MHVVTQEINLNLIPGGVPPMVNVSQYDKGSRMLKLQLYLGTDEYQIPEGAMACIQGTKLDGTGFLYVCEYSGNTITADVTDQMTVVPGKVKCEAFLQEETEKRIGTANFVIVVEKATLQDDDHISETEIPLIGTIGEAALKAMASEKAAKASEQSAKDSENKSKASENAAKNSKDASKASQDAAKQSENNAKSSEGKAFTSEKNAKASETAAQKSAQAAAQSASNLDAAKNNARSYAVGGTGTRTGEDTDNSKYYSEQAKAAKEDAVSAKNTAGESRNTAGTSERNAAASASSASDSQSSAAVSEGNAKTSAAKAADSESNAKTSETQAQRLSDQATNSSAAAIASSKTSQSYAVGGTGTRAGEDTDNAKYYASKAKNAAQTEKGTDLLEASGRVLLIANAATAGVHQLVIEGQSSQASYMGKNLHSNKYAEQQKSNLRLTPFGEGGYIIYGTMAYDRETFDCGDMHLPAGDYILSKCDGGSSSTYDFYYDVYAGTQWKRTVILAKGETTFSLAEGEFLRGHIEVFKGSYYNVFFFPMIRRADVTDGTFEPYVGEKASPSIDYPQEIISLSNAQIIFQGKNLFKDIGTRAFNINGGVTVLDPETFQLLIENFAGKMIRISYDIETSKDFSAPSTGTNRFGLEGVFKTTRNRSLYTGIQAWNNGNVLKAGEKKHFSVNLTIKNEAPAGERICKFGDLVFYVQCIGTGFLTLSNLQMEFSDTETEYEEPKISSVVVPYTLRSIGDIHDELIIREDGTGELIQRIWHKELRIADMNNSEDFPGWILGSEEVGKVINRDFNGTLWSYGLNGYCSVAPMQRVNVNTFQQLFFLSSLNIKQSDLKSRYPNLVVTLDLPYLNPVVTELSSEEVQAMLTGETFSPQTTVYSSAGGNFTVQYYNAAVQGGQDQIKSLKKDLSAEIKRAGDAEKQISDKQAEDKKILTSLSTGLGTLEVKTFTGKCLKGGGFDVGRIATFPSHPIALWTESRLGEAQNLVFNAHAYSDGWFIDVTNRAGTDITDVELTIKVLIATPAA